LQPIKFKADGPESPTTPWCSGTTASGQSHAGVRRRFSPGRDDEGCDVCFPWKFMQLEDFHPTIGHKSIFGSAKDWIRMVEMLRVASARKKSKWPHHCGRGKVSKGNQIDSNHNWYCTVALIFVLNMQHVIEFICRIPFTLTKNKHLSLVATPSAVVKGSASIYIYICVYFHASLGFFFGLKGIYAKYPKRNTGS